ncbi:alpha/beta hydrolase fold domain-containing protein [Hyphococcus sp.]|uniref:alpha/beta hydrolase fold domain-containing protein n=1 Tax=Hyphococcus sp. TaxID=2038636 RepID=UPI003752CE4A
MSLAARRIGTALSTHSRKRVAELRAYPTIETWMNPVTRGLARRLANLEWQKTLAEIDFEYRLTDVEIAGTPCVEYETAGPRREDLVILYVHGGAFVSGSPHFNASMILPAVHLTGAKTIGASYPLLPEGRYPAPLEAIDRVYRAILEEYADRRIVMFADSIGGAITLSNLLRWRDGGLRLPERVVFASPALDGAGASDTHKTLDGHDPLIRSNRGRNAQKLFQFYAPGKDVKDPMISPIYGDFTGLPPMLIHVGSREVLLGDAARLAEATRQCGVESTLRVFDGMFHLFHMHWSLAEAKSAHDDVAKFIRTQ